MAIPSNPILIGQLLNEAVIVEDDDTLLIDQDNQHKRISGAAFKASLLDTWQKTNGDLFFDTGNVGIGINAPTAGLHLVGRQFLAMSEGQGLHIDNTTIAGGNTDLLISQSAAASILGEFLRMRSDGVDRVIFNADGTLITTAVITAVNFQLASDARDKIILEELGGDKVKFIRFKTKEDERDRYGVSAQELQKTMPDLVEKGRGGKLVVKYIDLLISEVARLSNKLELIQNAST